MKYEKLYDLIKQEHVFEGGYTNLAAPENEELIKQLQACVAEYEKNSTENEIYIFDIFGNVKWFNSYDECAEFLGIKKTSISSAILLARWVGNKWQVRRAFESAINKKIKTSRFLKFERGQKIEIKAVKDFSDQAKVSGWKIIDAYKKGEKIKGWKISQAELDVEKLKKNGVVFDD